MRWLTYPRPQEHIDMKVNDFQICKDENAVEFVQFTEGQTKIQQGGLHTKHRDLQPRMFAVGGERCPVALCKQFVSRPPQNLKTSGPFYLSIKTNRRPQMRRCGLKYNQRGKTK